MISIAGVPYRGIAESTTARLLHSGSSSLFLCLVIGFFALTSVPCAQAGITLTASPNPSVFGAPVTLTATVAAGATGKVTFYDGVTVLGTSTLSAGTATLSTILLPSGSRKVLAYYGGDGTNPAGNSNVVTQSVNANPSRSFATPGASVPTEAGPSQVLVADFDGDGKADLAVLNFGGSAQGITILSGNGDGTFRNTASYQFGGSPIRLAVADFDGDGKPDIAVAFVSSVGLLLGNGDGTFHGTPTYAVGTLPSLIAAADFNHDGKADVVSVNDHDNTVSVLLGNGDGTFQPAVTSSVGGSFDFNSEYSLAVGDFNGDGLPDLAVGNPTLAAVGILLGKGDGTFQPPVSYPFPGGWGFIAAADFNGDGKTDLVLWSSDVWVMLGSGDGTFQTPVSYPTAKQPLALLAGDVNGDGKDDVVAGILDTFSAGQPVSSAYVLPGDGSGLLATVVAYPITGLIKSAALGDFNGDGRPDLVLASDNLNILLGAPSAAALDIAMTHAGTFTQGQGATYTITVTNAALAGLTSGTVTVTGLMPVGLSLLAMAGGGWSCAGNTCQRSDAINPGSGYPPITVAVRAANDAPPRVTSQVSVSGGGTSITATAFDPTVIAISPLVPILTAPADGATGVSLTPTLSWSGGVPTYFVGVAPSVFGFGYSASTIANSITVPAGSLLPGTRYTWQITAVGNGFYRSATWSFTTAGTPPPPVFVCFTNVSVTPSLRGEGSSDSAGDITLNCGGAANTLPLGSAIPTADITLTLNTAVTSRLLPPGSVSNVSEALLLIDEPGSGLDSPTGYGSPFFASAPQTVCPTPLTGCTEYVSSVTPTNGGFIGTPLFVATNTPQGNTATVAGYNMFRGTVSGNSVTFHGIPILSTIGTPGVLTRVFRITNLRADATQIAASSSFDVAARVVATIGVTGTAPFPVSVSAPTVGYVQTGLTATATAAPSLSQCNSQTRSLVNVLSFSESFGTAFKTRVDAQNTNTLYAGQSGNPAQNIPGQFHNSESNFVLGVGGGQIAGLADFGTRLKAAFSNIPPGVRLFVSTSNVTNAATPVTPPAVIGGNAVVSFAQLVPGESGAFSAVASTDLAPGSAGTVPVVELAVVNGSATAVWEIVNTNPNSIETFKFAVYTTYIPTATTGAPAVALSFPPPAASGAVPRFNTAATAVPLFSSAACTPAITVAKTHIGNFRQGQMNATYTVTVTNGASAAPASGTVTVTETVPTGLTLVSMSGAGWTCPASGTSCTRSDALNGGASYTAITVTVNVAPNATSPQVNSVSVSGGGSATAGATDSTTVVAAPVLTADSVSPASNTANATLTAVYGDTAGFADLGYVHLLINSGLSASNACYVAYQRSGNTLILLNDAGNGWLGPIPAGSAGALQNGQCVLNGIGSSATGTGNSLSFTASLSFKPSFTGSKTVFLYADGNDGINSGWQSRGTWTVPGKDVLTANSVAPSSGNAVNATLTAVYSDTAGYTSLGYAHLLINFGLVASNACYVAYQRSGNTMILLNDAGSGWLGPIAAGAAGTLQNSQCVLNGIGSSATGSGNSLSFTASLSFKSSFVGSKTVFLYADGAGGVNSGWQSRGAWTVPTNLVLTADSVSPSSGNTANPTLTAVYSDTAGYTSLGYVHLLINSGLSASNACYVAYQGSGNTLILLNDAGAGWLGPITAGSGMLQNSQCVLNGIGSSATGSGNSLNFTASLSFKSSFAGGKTVFLYADGAGGINSGWQNRGTWTVPGSEVLTANSVSPSSGNTGNATLTAAYSDTAGYTNLGYAHLLINGGLSATNACYVAYQPTANTLILLNDAGSGWLGPIAAGSAGTLQNSQCVLNASGSSATGSGSNLTLTVSLTFKPSFTGSKTVFLYADGSGGLNSGWQSRGTWTVP